jgi:hypothetical protein
MFYENFTNTNYHAQGAAQIAMNARETEKKLAIIKAMYRQDAAHENQPNQKKSRNPLRALLGIFLAGF